jgi:predicted XRE-type DNA-binding protein
MNNRRFESIWDAIEDMPETAETMKLRSDGMMALQQYMIRNGLSQTEAAKRFGVTQPRIAELMQGKINLFDLDALIRMTTRAGLHCEIQFSETGERRAA